ncbi:hypothetical protein ABZ897_54115 [Nonomuraea sp. NPDC046802]|uniref:hypothetical protein n=1 Tax=Nonomuraea sp. NPDC046802 TaxID=3154919 RepID=UPI0033DF45F3
MTNVATLLEGQWTNTYTEVDGKAVEQTPSVVEFRGGNFTIEQDGKVVYRGTYNIGPVLDNEPSQHNIVLFYKESINPLFLGGPRAGIFQISGDYLKTVFAGVGNPAPRQFNTFGGSEQVLTVYPRLEVASRASDGKVTLFGSNSTW